MPNCEDCMVEGLSSVTNAGANIFRFNSMTNAICMPYVEVFTGATFQNSPRIPELIIPRAKTLSGQTANIARDAFNVALNGNTVINEGWGLKRLRIGDGLESMGQNSFWNQRNLKTIEFVTDDENWIDTWNNKVFLTQFFGVASAIEGKSDEASLTQLPRDQVPSSVYSVTGGYPTPTTLKRIRWSEADNQ